MQASVPRRLVFAPADGCLEQWNWQLPDEGSLTGMGNKARFTLGVNDPALPSDSEFGTKVYSTIWLANWWDDNYDWHKSLKAIVCTVQMCLAKPLKIFLNYVGELV